MQKYAISSVIFESNRGSSRGLTLFSRPVRDAHLLEELHGPTICDVHLRPLSSIQVALDKHAFDAMTGQLKSENETGRARADDKDRSLMLEGLPR